MALHAALMRLESVAEGLAGSSSSPVQSERTEPMSCDILSFCTEISRPHFLNLRFRASTARRRDNARNRAEARVGVRRGRLGSCGSKGYRRSRRTQGLMSACTADSSNKARKQFYEFRVRDQMPQEHARAPVSDHAIYTGKRFQTTRYRKRFQTTRYIQENGALMFSGVRFRSQRRA
jgi:hypothetical protein